MMTWWSFKKQSVYRPVINFPFYAKSIPNRHIILDCTQFMTLNRLSWRPIHTVSTPVSKRVPGIKTYQAIHNKFTSEQGCKQNTYVGIPGSVYLWLRINSKWMHNECACWKDQWKNTSWAWSWEIPLIPGDLCDFFPTPLYEGYAFIYEYRGNSRDLECYHGIFFRITLVPIYKTHSNADRDVSVLQQLLIVALPLLA